MASSKKENKMPQTISEDNLIKAFQEEYEHKNKKFLLFELSSANENSHTKVLKYLLEYKNNFFLESFLERVGLPNKNSADTIKIEDQKPSLGVVRELLGDTKNNSKIRKGDGFMDLFFKYDNESVILENKIYGASDTPHQLARYIASINDINEDKFIEWYNGMKTDNGSSVDILKVPYVLYLTLDGSKEPSDDSFPQKLKEKLDNRFLPINYSDDILPWLEEDVMPQIPYEEDGMMIAGLRQYISFLKQLLYDEKSEVLCNFFRKLDCLNDVEKYNKIIEIAKSLKESDEESDDIPIVLKSLRKELEVFAESIFVNDTEGIMGDWRIHFTPSFICLYKQSWASLDTRKYSIPSIYFCGDQTDKFLKGSDPYWKLQIDHLGNNYVDFQEAAERIGGKLKLGPVARFDIHDEVSNNTFNPNNKDERKEYYRKVTDSYCKLIKVINDIVANVPKDKKENFNLQKHLLGNLINKWPIMTEENNIVYFESDEEFTDFCVAHYAIVKRSADGTLSVEGQYSDMYKKYIEEGKTFIIKDEDSQVYKHQCVSKRVPVQSTGRSATVQLPVQNLEQYFEDLEDE